MTLPITVGFFLKLIILGTPGNFESFYHNFWSRTTSHSLRKSIRVILPETCTLSLIVTGDSYGLQNPSIYENSKQTTMMQYRTMDLLRVDPVSRFLPRLVTLF
jgi:hypothetical protein